MPKTYVLLGADGISFPSTKKGSLGGNRRAKIYGRLDCPSALSALRRFGATGPYAKHRVFFASEADAVRAGYRPCGRCLRDKYRSWKETTRR